MEPIIEIRRSNKGDFQSLLLRAAIPNESREVTIEGLAKWIGITDSAMFKYIKKDEIPFAMARSIVAHNNLYWLQEKLAGRDIDESRIIKDSDFYPYLTDSGITKRQKLLGHKNEK